MPKKEKRFTVLGDKQFIDRYMPGTDWVCNTVVRNLPTCATTRYVLLKCIGMYIPKHVLSGNCYRNS